MNANMWVHVSKRDSYLGVKTQQHVRDFGALLSSRASGSTSPPLSPRSTTYMTLRAPTLQYVVYKAVTPSPARLQRLPMYFCVYLCIPTYSYVFLCIPVCSPKAASLYSPPLQMVMQAVAGQLLCC